MNSVLTLLKLLVRPTIAGGNNLLNRYERTFAETIIGDSTLPALAFWKGRVALWNILRAADLKEVDEVILPAYTCEMVPIAVKFAGAKCMYADVDNCHFNASLKCVKDALTEQTRVVICQHTYGITQPVCKFKSLMHGRQITLIEDCCQLISAESTDSDIGVTGAASFFSTQWNKPFSTGLGGMAVFRDQNLYILAKGIRQTFSHSHNSQRTRSLALQILLHNFVVRPRTRAIIGAAYRWAQRSGWIQGSNTAQDYEDTMPQDYLASATNVQALIGLEQLRLWPENVRHRRTLTAFYLESLHTLGVDIAPLKTGSNEPNLWAIPLLVENKREILSIAGRRGLPIATWFDRTPVHVNAMTANRYDYRPGQCPLSEQMFSQEIHLLTAPWVTLEQADKTIQLLRQHARLEY